MRVGHERSSRVVICRRVSHGKERRSSHVASVSHVSVQTPVVLDLSHRSLGGPTRHLDLSSIISTSP